MKRLTRRIDGDIALKTSIAIGFLSFFLLLVLELLFTGFQNQLINKLQQSNKDEINFNYRQQSLEIKSKLNQSIRFNSGNLAIILRKIVNNENESLRILRAFMDFEEHEAIRLLDVDDQSLLVVWRDRGKVLHGTDFPPKTEIGHFPLVSTSLIDQEKRLGSVEIYYSQKTAQKQLEVNYQEMSDRFKKLEQELREEQRGIIVLQVISTFLIVAILMFGLNLLLKRIVIQPVSRLNYKLKSVASGDLEKKIETYRQDEIGELARTFEFMRDSIREKLQLIERQNRKLEDGLCIIQEKNEELQKIDKLKDEFLANTSHELKTPLNGIIGIADSMYHGDSGTLSENQKENISMLIASGRRLFSLINDLLDFHKINHNKLKIHKKPVNLKSIVQVVLRMTRHSIGSKPIQIFNNVPNNLPPVNADEVRLEQILYNLIGNAIKFTEKGKVSVFAESKGDAVRISVEDTGVGIAEDQLERVFMPLEQIDGEMTRSYEGTGLGLSISRELVALHDGQFEVESTLNEGSVFHFSIPSIPWNGQEPALLEKERSTVFINDLPNTSFVSAQKSDEGKFYDFDPQKSTILIVDDDRINLQVLINYLSTGGYNLLSAESGMEALKIMEEKLPDLILLDIMMPKMSGYEVCRRIREEHDPITLPVIYLTARSRVEDLVEGFHSGANDYLTKPFFREELFARVAAHLHSKLAADYLKENETLQHEIIKRKEAEKGLRRAKRHLAKMVDASDEAIFCVDERGSITFFNHGAKLIFGYSSEFIRGESVDLLFTDSFLSQYREKTVDKEGEKFRMMTMGKTKSGRSFQAEVTVMVMNRAEDRYYILTVRHIVPSSRISDEISTESWNNTANRDILAGTIVELEENSLETVPELLQESQTIEESESEDEDYLETTQIDPYRALLVKTMKEVLRLWKKSTGEGKIELAEKSGIWKVYIDRGTWQTRTMDKYLSLPTLPRYPRWRDILNSAEFVLKSCNLSKTDQGRFLKLITQLETAIGNRKQKVRGRA